MMMTIEGVKGKWLSESISHNIARGETGEDDLFFFNTLLNVVKACIDVFCASTRDRIVSDVDRTFVVAMKGDGSGKWKTDF